MKKSTATLLMIFGLAFTLAAPAFSIITSSPHQSNLSSPSSRGVTLHVTVMNQKNDYVTGLKEGDIMVFEGKTPLTVISFSGGDEPADVAIVVDYSSFMTEPAIKYAVRGEALKEGLSRLVRGSHASSNFFLTGFSDKSHTLTDWTRDGKALAEGFEVMTAKGRSTLFDACKTAVEKLAEGKHQKKVLILVSVGADSGSRVSFKEMRALLRVSDVLLYAIAPTSPDTWQADPSSIGMRGYRVLDELSSVTGGQVFNPSQPRQVSAAFDQIALELSRQYSVVVRPGSAPTPGEWRRLEVRVSKAAVTRAAGGGVSVRGHREYAMR